jgi:hypothetical protein
MIQRNSHISKLSDRRLLCLISVDSFALKRAARVARFFLAQYTKTGRNRYTKLPLNYKMAIKFPNERSIFQNDVVYANLFRSKSLLNLPKLGFLV